MNVNPMQIMQMMKGGGNPQQMLMGMLQQQAGNNPVLKSAMDLMQKGDMKGVENIARNVAKEKGINPEEAPDNLHTSKPILLIDYKSKHHY